MKKLLLIIIVLLCAAAPRAAHAKGAEIMMLPTRVVMNNNDRFGTIVIKNVGTETGNFSVDVVDMKMQESGLIVPYEANETPQYSAMPYIHIAPRSMTLQPGEAQNVRLLLRKPENLEPGEYRAHLKVHLVDNSAGQNDAPRAGISVRTNMVIVIPVIIRNGATTVTSGITDPKLAHDANGAETLGMYLTREGTQSSMGDITVTLNPDSPNPTVLKTYRGVSVYRPTPRRFISVPLDESPSGLSLDHAKLGITYTAQEQDGGKLLAETEMKVP